MRRTRGLPGERGSGGDGRPGREGGRGARVPGAAALVALLLAPVAALAVDPSRPIYENVQTVWTSDQGLRGNSMTEVFQDSRGYVWLASFNGIVRFDGLRFRSFPESFGGDVAARSANVIVEGDKGVLWFGTNGDGLVRFAGGKLLSIQERNGLPSDVVRALAPDGAGGVFVGTSGGAVRVDRTGTVSRVFPESLSRARIEMLALDRRGGLWVSVGSGPLYRLKDRGASPPEEVALPGAATVLAMLEDRDGTLWFGTRDGRILRRGDETLVDESPRLGLGGRAVNSLVQDRQGAIWASSDSGVVRLYRGQVARFDGTNGLVDEQVNRIREDHEGSVWIATARGGITKLSSGKAVTLTPRQGLVSDTVNAVLEDRDGNVWIGTDKGLSVFRDGAFVSHPLAREIGSLRVRHIHQDRAGRIWLSTYGDRGVVILDGGKIRNLSASDGLTGNRCRMVYEDRAGAVWIATSNGLNRLRDGRIRTFTRKDGLADEYVLGVFEDSARDLWVGTNGGGVYRLRGEKLEGFRKADGLGSDIVFSVMEDSKNELWATTSAGVSLFRGGRFVSFTTQHGLYGNAIFQMLEDRAGRFWMRADTGIIMADAGEMRTLLNGRPRRVATRLFDGRDGLLGAPTPVSWACQTASGDLWSPTLKGVAIISTRRLPENPIPPPVYVEEVVVDGEPHAPDTLTTLEPGSRRVTFRYSGLSYQVPERVLFRVMLEGFDAGWSDATPGREATFTTLPPGRYTFRVKACNNDGRWTSDVASVTFSQRPLFRQSAGFAFLVAAALSGVGAAVLAYRHRHTRRREAELEALVAARTEEINRKSLLLEEQKRELEESQALIREANASLERLSRTDVLTGLANRRHAQEVLEREWARHVREKRSLGALMIDVDSFKAFNDLYGHHAGDSCLSRVAEAIAGALRERVDVPARFGGEEFLVLLPGADLSGAEVAGERVREAVERLEIPHARSLAAGIVTVSVGAAAVLPRADESPESVVQAADRALYVSKEGGRNRVSSVT